MIVKVPMHRKAILAAFLLLFLLIQAGARHLLAQPTPDSPRIRLQAATFDPLADRLSTPPTPDTKRGEDRQSTHLVQFDGPVQEAWKTAVREAGAHLYGYIPDHAFIARLDAATAEKVRALPFVRWVGPYKPAYRLAPTLAGLTTQATGTTTVTVETLPDANLEGLAEQIAAWDGTVAGRGGNAAAGYLRVTLPPDRLDDLAGLDGVLWVEPYFEPRLQNDVGGGTILRANEVRASVGLFGAGQIVAIADTGLDLGTTDPAMSDDFEGRIVEGQALCAASGQRDGWSDLNGHGTHVSGSVLGSGQNSGSTPAVHDYSNSFAGIAPEAQLIFQSVDSNGDSSLECIPTDMVTSLFGPAYSLGARIHSNSWGGPTSGYTTESQQVDTMMWQHPDLLLLFAAGNNGTDANADGVVDPHSLSTPGTAKNVLTVGASENLRPQRIATWGNSFRGFPAEPIASDRLADNANGMAAFSGRGPTDDGRIKPDVVAPGTWIISARSHVPTAGTGWGAYDANYVYMGGTSMATPLTAGAATLVREWLVRMKNVTSPSAALIKAVLLGGAADISPGQYGSGSTREVPATRPNNVSGWGRVDLVESLVPPAPRQIWFADNTTGVPTGGSAVYTLTVSTPPNLGEERREWGAGAPLMTPVPAIPPQPGGGQEGVAEALQLLPVPSLQLPAPSGLTAIEQLIQNGSFETNDAWYGQQAAYTTAQAHSGNRSVTIIPGQNGYFFQTVGFPSDALSGTLTYYWKNLNPDVGNDLLQVLIYDETLSTYYGYGPLHSIADTGWQPVTLDLSNILGTIRGRTINVLFYVTQNSAAPNAAFFVDDVALYVNRSGTSTPTRTATRTPTATADPQAGGPLRITLVWTDYPGEPAAAKALVNDLDLEVIGPDGSHYVGNQGVYAAGHACLRSGRWDACNTVEGVILPQAGYGTYTVIVRGAQVAQGGRQPFALVASGDRLQEATGETPTPTPTRTPASTATSTPTPTTSPATTPTVVGDLGWQTIRGTVRRGDTTGLLPIAGATVSYTHFSLVRAGSSGSTTTGAEGRYAFDPIFLHDTDTVQVRVEVPGFEPQQMQRSGLHTWNNPVFDFALTPREADDRLYLPIILR